MKRDIKFEIRFNKEEMERIEEIAKKLGIPKSRVIRNLTILGLEDAEIYNKLGFFDIVNAIKKLREKALETKNINIVTN